MKFIHLGDLHLGKSLLDFDLIDDQRYILEQIISVAKEQEVDGVLIAGDIYDKSIPSEAAVNLFDDFLNTLTHEKIKAFIISGNHDSDDRLNFGSSLFASHEIYIGAKFQGELEKVVVEDAYGEVIIYLMPFMKASHVKHYFPEDKIENYDDAVRTVIAHANIDTTKRNLLLAHQFVTGKGEDPLLGGSEGAGTQTVGLVEKIGYDCFQDFDYVALGHIHSSQKVGRDEVRYSGSPLKYSLSEAGHVKSIPVVNVLEKGKIEIDFMQLQPKRDLRHLKGKLSDLLNPSTIMDQNDFIYATLTDEEIFQDAMSIFQQYYPFTVRIDYDNSHTKGAKQVDFTNIAKNRSFTELISDFYQQMYGCEISDDELQIMREVAREAGVADETN